VERVSPVEPLAATPWHKLDMKHVLHANQFDKASLDLMFEEAIKMEQVWVAAMWVAAYACAGLLCSLQVSERAGA